jgi:hypothetical protein
LCRRLTADPLAGLQERNADLAVTGGRKRCRNAAEARTDDHDVVVTRCHELSVAAVSWEVKTNASF